MRNLHFAVNAQLVIGGASHSFDEFTDPGLGTNMSVGPEQSSLAQDRPNQFWLHAWVGDSSYEHSIDSVQKDGSSIVNLNLENGDVNTLKLGLVYTTPSATGPRARDLCSSFIPVSTLFAHLEGSHPNKCFFMKDNFNQNAAILTFENRTSDIEKLRKLKLRTSALLEQDGLNQAVFNMGTQLRNKLTACNVSPANAGGQFIDGFTFCPMQSVLKT